MRCTKCGIRLPKPVVEHTASKRELVERVRSEMAKQAPKLPQRSSVPQDAYSKAKEDFYVRVFEKYQQEYRRTKTGKIVHTGERR